MQAFLDVRSDGSERVKYDYDGYFSYVRRAPLSLWQNYSADSHWHDDVEFIAVLSGYMDYNVNGKIIRINSGQGIIVNSRQLHFGFSKEKKECEFICILLHPMLLCASHFIESEFVAPLLAENSLPYIFLDENVKWQQIILENLKTISDKKNEKSAPLLIQSLFYNIWFLLNENVIKEKNVIKKDRNLAVLKNMISFIQKNYAKNISLEDIAAAGSVSKSTCLAVFKKYVQNTPSNYLVCYRLKKAAALLVKSRLTVSEIAFETGFKGTSYFCEAFKKNYSCTPSEYRTQLKKF